MLQTSVFQGDGFDGVTLGQNFSDDGSVFIAQCFQCSNAFLSLVAGYGSKQAARSLRVKQQRIPWVLDEVGLVFDCPPQPDVGGLKRADNARFTV